MTDVIDGPPGAEARAAQNAKEQPFPTLTVGNDRIAPARDPQHTLGRFRTSDATLAPAPEASALAPHAPSATQLGPAAPHAIPPTQPQPPWMLRAAAPPAPAAAPKPFPADVSATRPTSMLRVAAPPKAEPADNPQGPPGPPLTAKLRAAPARDQLAGRLGIAVPPQADPIGRPEVAEPPRPVRQGPALPVPPRDDEKFRYVRRNAWILTVFSVASFPLLLFSQIRLMLEYHWFWVYSPCVILAALFLALPLLTDGLSRAFDFGEHQRLVDSWRPAKYPSVDVFLPVCGEPVDVLRNTWKYVAEMREHYPGTVTPYVLDDSHSPELKQMAREFGFAYATRPNRGWFKKSGNLWFGFQVSYGDYILLLDADFAPRHDLLNESLPYMEAYPDTGIVQTPQFFRIANDQTWVERGAGAVQELFYRSIQTARARKGGSICVGSCAVYRRAALQDNLGMTLAEHSEDVLTGFDLNSMGWRLRYLPVALSTGNCPDNVLAFLNQQYRWCSGTVGLLFGKRFWGAKLPLYTRMCYISGLIYYIYTALFTFVVPALTIAILVFLPQVLLFKNMIFMVPVLVYSAIIIPSWHHAPYRLEAWAVRVIAGWAHLFAYWDAARGKRMGWKPSGGDKKKQDGRRRFWGCFIVWTLGSSIVWTGLAFWRMITMNPYNFIVLFGLGLFELLIAARVLLQPATDDHT